MSTQRLLSHYEVLEKIGEGGMGQVWKARDTRLHRTVAIKVLSAQLLDDPEFRRRFLREARAISGLNHPNICTLFDIDEFEGVPFLVMEYLEGGTLAARLQQGPLPAAEALRVAIEIAAALDHAHQRGILHRDLKPGNILLVKTGIRLSPKLLDFGLAKTFRPDGVMADTASMPLTRAGMVMGTLNYMSPEQVSGTQVDPRSDIFSFGAMLYEMLTGTKAFRGDSESAIMAAVLSANPAPVSSLSPVTPAALERIVVRCLQKDPGARFQSSRDLLSELEFVASEAAAPEASSAAAPPFRARSRERIAWAVAMLCFVAAAAGAFATGWIAARKPASQAAIEFTVGPPPGESFPAGGLGGGGAVSPDGTRLVFVATHRGEPTLWLRPLASVQVTPVVGTEGAFFPFWSPDGKQLGFFAGGKLKRVAASGGPVLELGDAPAGRGASWSSQGFILYAPDSTGRLYRIPEAGGAPQLVSEPDPKQQEDGHLWPWFLPDGKRFLFLSRRVGRNGSQVSIGSLEHRQDQPHQPLVASNYNAQYSPSGHLLFVRDGVLLAQRFDPASGKLSGEPAALAGNIATRPHLNLAEFSVGAGGVLLANATGVQTTQVAWVDRAGKMLKLLDQPQVFIGLRLSQDAERLATARADAVTTIADLWVHDLRTESSARVTFDDGRDFSPVWSPDGSMLAFASTRSGVANLYLRPTQGTGSNRRLTTSSMAHRPFDWSPDGRYLLYEQAHPDTKRDLWALPVAGSQEAQPVVQSSGNETQGQFSPDGRFVAYASDESGRAEVYIRDFPFSGAQWQISTAGGSQPLWRGDGRELFYIAPDGMLMSAPIDRAGASLRPGRASALFSTGSSTGGWVDHRFDVSPDGQRFLLLAPPAAAVKPEWTVTAGVPLLGRPLQ